VEVLGPTRLAEQPAEDAGPVGGVGDPVRAVLAEDSQDVVGGDRPPVDVARRLVGPALDPSKRALDARPEPTDPVGRRRQLVVDDLARGVEHGHGIVGAREQEPVSRKVSSSSV
jgi:hypothetical protein